MGVFWICLYHITPHGGKKLISNSHHRWSPLSGELPNVNYINVSWVAYPETGEYQRLLGMLGPHDHTPLIHAPVHCS